MKIEYQKKMATRKVIDREKNEGMTEAAIEKLEQKIGKKFPRSYREFLYLGGETANMLLDFESSVTDDYWEGIRQEVIDNMAENDIKIEEDFWVLASTDAGAQVFFFYFDGKDDPDMYRFNSSEYPDAGIKKENQTLTELINWCIDYRKREGY